MFSASNKKNLRNILVFISCLFLVLAISQSPSYSQESSSDHLSTPSSPLEEKENSEEVIRRLLGSVEIYKGLLAEAQRTGDRPGEADALWYIARAYRVQQKIPESISYYEESLAVYRDLGIINQEIPLRALNELASLYSSISEFNNSLKLYNEALSIHRKLEGRKQQEGEILETIGSLYEKVGNRQQVLRSYKEALDIYQELDSGSEKVAILSSNIGAIYRATGNPREALKYYDKALTFFVNEEDIQRQAVVLNNIGLAHNALGENQAALEYYERALALYKDQTNSAAIATTLNNIGWVHYELSMLEESLNYYNQALSISEEIDDGLNASRVLSNIATTYADLGQSERALDYYKRSLKISEEIKNHPNQGTALSNIASVYANIGQIEESLAYYKQAISIHRRVDNLGGLASALSSVGSLAIQSRYFDFALDSYKEALEISRKMESPVNEADALSGIGTVYSKTGKYQKALEYLDEALQVTRDKGNASREASILNNIGATYSKLEEQQKALEFLNEALVIARDLTEPYTESEILSNLGFVYQQMNRVDDAIDVWEKSLTTILNLRKILLRKNRQDFLQYYDDIATPLISLLIQGGEVDRAYEIVNLVTSSDLADYSRLINAKTSNSEAQKFIDEWTEKKQRLESFRRDSPKGFSEELSKKVRELEAEVFSEAEEISNKFPEVAELFETKLIDIKKLRESVPGNLTIIQPTLLRFDEALEGFSSQVVIFVVTKENLSVSTINIKPEELDNLLNQYRVQLQDPKNADYIDIASKLYEKLIRPAEDKIKTRSLFSEKVAIVATGKLRYIPFETLYDKTRQKFLIEKYSISYLTRFSSQFWQSPSRNDTFDDFRYVASSTESLIVFIIVTILFVVSLSVWILKKIGFYLGSIVIVTLVTVMGGLVFSLQTNVVLQTSLLDLATRGKAENLSLLALGNPVPVQPFSLPSAEKEAKDLNHIFSNSETLLGSEASLDKFKLQSLNFSLLHLATHGCFDPEGCCLRDEGCLSEKDMDPNTLLFANEEQLNIADASQLGLDNTDLITLSACQTALKTDSNGLEISGLAYIFERAGARSVLASLWNVEDETTKDIMVQFYQSLKQGMSKDRALQKAKLSQIERHPFFWSPFILIGDSY